MLEFINLFLSANNNVSLISDLVFADEDVFNLKKLRCSTTEHLLLLNTVEVSASKLYDLLKDLDPHKACGLDFLLAGF